jgi:hypothetical protein
VVVSVKFEVMSVEYRGGHIAVLTVGGGGGGGGVSERKSHKQQQRPTVGVSVSVSVDSSSLFEWGSTTGNVVGVGSIRAAACRYENASRFTPLCLVSKLKILLHGRVLVAQ